MNYYFYGASVVLSFIGLCIITLLESRELRSRAMYVYVIISLVPFLNTIAFGITAIMIIIYEVTESLLNEKGSIVFKMPFKDE
jgi:hypothetical protein